MGAGRIWKNQPAPKIVDPTCLQPGYVERRRRNGAHMAFLGDPQLEPQMLCPPWSHIGLFAAVLSFVVHVLRLIFRVPQQRVVAVLMLAMWILVREHFARVRQWLRLCDLQRVNLRIFPPRRSCEVGISASLSLCLSVSLSLSLSPYLSVPVSVSLRISILHTMNSSPVAAPSRRFPLPPVTLPRELHAPLSPTSARFTTRTKADANTASTPTQARRIDTFSRH